MGILTLLIVSNAKKSQLSREEFEQRLALDRIVLCGHCEGSDGYIKPEIVFYGENLPSSFKKNYVCDFNSRGLDSMGRPKNGFKLGPHCDLLIIMGTTLAVAPVNMLPKLTYKPRVYINMEYHPLFTELRDVQINEDCDSVTSQLML